MFCCLLLTGPADGSDVPRGTYRSCKRVLCADDATTLLPEQHATDSSSAKMAESATSAWTCSAWRWYAYYSHMCMYVRVSQPYSKTKGPRRPKLAGGLPMSCMTYLGTHLEIKRSNKVTRPVNHMLLRNMYNVQQLVFSVGSRVSRVECPTRQYGSFRRQRCGQIYTGNYKTACVRFFHLCSHREGAV